MSSEIFEPRHLHYKKKQCVGNCKKRVHLSRIEPEKQKCKSALRRGGFYTRQAFGRADAG